MFTFLLVIIHLLFLASVSTSGQHVRGAACTGTGTGAPYCPSVIQDCSPYDPIGIADCDGRTQNCGYLSIRGASNVEIDNLKIYGNTGGANQSGIARKGIYGSYSGGPFNNLYVHDLFVTETSAESIYSDAPGDNTRFIRNTVSGSSTQGINSNNYGMTNVQFTDNYIFNMSGGCILVASYDAYVLRNTCLGGGSLTSGADVVNITTTSFQVVAYNTIQNWNSGCCAVGIVHIGFPQFPDPFENYNGAGVYAYNTITNNLFTHVPAEGAAVEIDNTTGPMVVAHNTITYNGDRGQPTNPGILILEGCAPGCPAPVTSAILISDNTLNGTSNDQTLGILIDSAVLSPNQIQINSSNTFGTTPTHTQYLVAPSGASMSVFNPTITRALPYLPNGLPINP
jgi:hypothetical protein